MTSEVCVRDLTRTVRSWDGNILYVQFALVGSSFVALFYGPHCEVFGECFCAGVRTLTCRRAFLPDLATGHKKTRQLLIAKTESSPLGIILYSLFFYLLLVIIIYIFWNDIRAI